MDFYTTCARWATSTCAAAALNEAVLNQRDVTGSAVAGTVRGGRPVSRPFAAGGFPFAITNVACEADRDDRQQDQENAQKSAVRLHARSPGARIGSTPYGVLRQVPIEFETIQQVVLVT